MIARLRLLIRVYLARRTEASARIDRDHYAFMLARAERILEYSEKRRRAAERQARISAAQPSFREATQ